MNKDICIHPLGFAPIGHGKWICRFGCDTIATNENVADLAPRFFYFNGRSPSNPTSKAGMRVSYYKKVAKQLKNKKSKMKGKNE